MSNYKIIGLADSKEKPSYNLIDEPNQSSEESMDNQASTLDNLPKPQGFLSKLPRNILSGLANAGRNLHNMPHDISEIVDWPIEKVSGIKGIISSHLPYDDYDYSKVFGANNGKTISDKVIQGAVEYAPELIGLSGLIRSGLRKFPITQKGAARQLRMAEKLSSDNSLKSIPLSEDIINESMPFLPKTHATRSMIDSVSKGGYKPSFSLQSQIGSHERALRKSPLPADRLISPAARELKERILMEMESGLRSQGRHDIADLMRGGLNDYRKYIKFRDEVKPYIKKIGIPTTALSAIGLGATHGKKVVSKIID